MGGPLISILPFLGAAEVLFLPEGPSVEKAIVWSSRPCWLIVLESPEAVDSSGSGWACTFPCLARGDGKPYICTGPFAPTVPWVWVCPDTLPHWGCSPPPFISSRHKAASGQFPILSCPERMHSGSWASVIRLRVPQQRGAAEGGGCWNQMGLSLLAPSGAPGQIAHLLCTPGGAGWG